MGSSESEDSKKMDQKIRELESKIEKLEAKLNEVYYAPANPGYVEEEETSYYDSEGNLRGHK
jgi:phage shock protein A